MSRLRAIIAAAAGCAFAPMAGDAAPPATRPAESKPAAGNISHCLRLLTDEAEKSKADGGLVRHSADFADSFGEAPPAAALLERLTRRAHSDPFIDAYIRWQLTSFHPKFDAAALTDREFERLLQSLPGCIDNPRADMNLLEALQRTAARGALSETQQKEVNDRLNDLATRASRADALNEASLEFRAWLADHFARQPQRLLMLLLDQAAALARAGWPAEEAKAQIDSTIEAVARLRDFTPQQRRDFLLAADKTMIRARMYLASAGVSEGALAVNYSTTGLFDYDVRRWARALDDER